MYYVEGDYVYVNKIGRYGYIVWVEGDKYLVEFNDGKSVEVTEDEFTYVEGA